jgi:hypothetical protein
LDIYRIGFPWIIDCIPPTYPGEDIHKLKFILINYYGKVLTGQISAIYGYEKLKKDTYGCYTTMVRMMARVILVQKQSDILDFALQIYVVTRQHTNVFGKTYTHITPHNTRIILIT